MASARRRGGGRGLVGDREASTKDGSVVASGLTADVALVERARNGDHDAFATLVRPHQETAFRVAFMVTGIALDAEDATQEGLMKAFAQIQRFDSERPFRPWLLRIVSNEARNRRRSAGRRSHYELRAAGHRDAMGTALDPSESAVRRDADERLLEAVNRLPAKERLVIGLRYFLELSEQEIANVAGVPKGTVKSRTARALTRLRDSIGEVDV